MSLVTKRIKREEPASLVRSDSQFNRDDTYQLIGHTAEVLGVDFTVDGAFLASCSADKSILIWSMENKNSAPGIIKGSKGAVMDVKWSRDSSKLYSCSSDTTVSAWDSQTGARIRKHTQTDIVNSIAVTRRGTEIIASSSDDGTIYLWDPREKEPIAIYKTDLPVIAVAIDELGTQIMAAGIDPDISVWDARTGSIAYKLEGHTDTVTGLAVHDGTSRLVSNGLDSTVRTWDIRPYATESRNLNIYDGAPASTSEQNIVRSAWSPDGSRIACGSADKTAVIWDTARNTLLNKLPGHLGTVNVVQFNPINENILATGSSDRTIVVGVN